MGILYSYNPFSVVGQYNINTFLYENKTKIISILVVVILVFMGIIAMQFNTGQDGIFSEKLTATNSIPSPLYGDGPFGVGLYLPSKETIESAINNEM